jgi:glycosyltransferase involved in cell wall biosynthesis
VDDKFINAVPIFDEVQMKSRRGSPVLFAGGIQRRKGLVTLAQAGLALVDIKFKLVGGVEAGLSDTEAIGSWFSSDRVIMTGVVPRAELAAHMCASAIFVFPSYCEGSARVIFEAMACGCYIITTENSGSIVQSGVHGRIVPVGDAGALAAAITYAVNNPDEVAKIGWANARLIREKYRQSHYADNVVAVYRKILS